MLRYNMRLLRLVQLVMLVLFLVHRQFSSVTGAVVSTEVFAPEETSCNLVRCSEDYICVNGLCIPDPCQDLECGEEEQCLLQDITCVTIPCYPNATCEPTKEDPCTLIECGFDEVCLNGECVANICSNIPCPVGQECVVKVDPCLIAPCPAFPTCVSIDICASVICIDGTLCIEGQCIPNTSLTCENTSCNIDEECYYKTIQCTSDSCTPIPSCRPLVLCPECLLGTTCIDGTCVPQTCENTECNIGENCVMTPIDCLVAPCPTEVPLCFPNDYNCIATTCLEGTSCVEGECVPNTCETLDCNIDEECILEEAQCNEPPCPIVAACVSTIDQCTLLLCVENSICVDGKCIQVTPTCGDLTCYFGEECYFQLKDSDCSATECPLVPVCKPVDRCAKVRCRPNYMCMNGRCVRQTCNRYSCGLGEECYFHSDPCYAFRVPSCRPAKTNRIDA